MPKPTEQLCANCGNNVKANAKFCPACGTKIETLELVDEEVKTQAKKWVGIRENLEFLEEFREEHSKKNNRKIDSGELRKWAISKLEKLIELKLGDAETNNKLKERLEKNKKIDYDEVDYLEDCLKGSQQLVEEQLGDKTEIIDEMLSRNIGNSKILHEMKTEVLADVKLNDQDFRYLLFCLHELEKQRIFETGIVPDGWLPSDLESQNEQQINELRHQVEKNTKYQKWGLAAYAHDRLKGQRTIKHYPSEKIWDFKENPYEKNKSKKSAQSNTNSTAESRKDHGY